MTEPVVSEAKLRYLDFLSREDRVRHHRYVEEMKQYELMKNGDLSAIGESARLWTSGLYGHVCDDPLRNAKYLFVTSITLATRFAIEGGMDEEDAYNASDLYIQDVDRCTTTDEVRRLHADMMTFFTWAMADMQRGEVHSTAVVECMDYIRYHLHERIGTTISRYIADQRMEAARNMLRYSQYSVGEIAQILAYRSPSHFGKVFKDHMGVTPREYRNANAQAGIWPE